MPSEKVREVARTARKVTPTTKARVAREGLGVGREFLYRGALVLTGYTFSVVGRAGVYEAFGVNATMPSIVTPMARSSNTHERSSASRSSSDPCPRPLAVSKKNLLPLLA